MLTAIALGFIIATIISNQLNQVVVFAEALGDGDLTQTIHFSSKDEIGTLAKSLNKSSTNIRELISEESASSSEEISSSINEVAMAIDDTAKSAQTQSELAHNLNNKIQKFKI